MTSVTLVASALFAIAAGSLYAYVGWRVSKRLASEESKEAVRQFGIWWLGLAAATFGGAVNSLLGAMGLLTTEWLFTMTLVLITILVWALRGLLYYLLYLFTGRNVMPYLNVFYAGYYVLLLYFIIAQHPAAVSLTKWSATLQYETTITGPLFTAVLLLLIFPQIIGALAYLTLLGKTRDPTQRYRIGLVSMSIIVWFGSSLLASFGGLSQQDWWQVVSRFLGLGAAFAMLLAYFPPGFLRRRYGLRTLAEDRKATPAATAPPPPPPPPPARREFRVPSPTAWWARFAAARAGWG